MQSNNPVFARMHEIPASQVPVWSGEIYLELHRATLTTQSHTKRLHRHAERALITADTATAGRPFQRYDRLRLAVRASPAAS